MTNSSNSLNPQTPANRPPKWAIIGVLAAGFAGFVDALYLTVNHYRQAIPPCSIGSCETVLTSRFATVAGVPLSLVGLLGYTLVLLLVLYYIDSRKPVLTRWVAILATASFAVSAILVSIQLFVLDAVCLYCMVSAATSTALFIFSLPLWKLK